MSRKILSVALGLILTASTTITYAADGPTKQDPQQKAVNSFNKQFENLVNSAVYARQDGFILKAVADGRNVTSAYNKNGKWIYTIENYPSVSLPKNIIDIVQNGYNSRGYFITTIDKIKQQGIKPVYLVRLQNNDTYKTLRVVNNDVEVIEDLQKI